VLAADLEVFISARAWETVVYTRIVSVAMKNYKELFLEHDADCFNAYLADVKSGKKRIATGALLPHENGGICMEASSRGLDRLLRACLRRPRTGPAEPV